MCRIPRLFVSWVPHIAASNQVWASGRKSPFALSNVLPLRGRRRSPIRKEDFGAVTRRLGEAAGELSDAEQGEWRANVQAVQSQIDAIARGDLSAALANAHPEVELEIFAPPEFEWVRHTRGIEELSAAIAHNFGSLDPQTPTIQNVITQADTVVLFVYERGIIRATGAPYDVQFVQRFTFEGGRLRSVRIVAARNGAAGF